MPTQRDLRKRIEEVVRDRFPGVLDSSATGIENLDFYNSFEEKAVRLMQVCPC
jgi:hypothetical protein